jgi:hypothetical protein
MNLADTFANAPACRPGSRATTNGVESSRNARCTTGNLAAVEAEPNEGLPATCIKPTVTRCGGEFFSG